MPTLLQSKVQINWAIENWNLCDQLSNFRHFSFDCKLSVNRFYAKENTDNVIFLDNETHPAMQIAIQNEFPVISLLGNWKHRDRTAPDFTFFFLEDFTSKCDSMGSRRWIFRRRLYWHIQIVFHTRWKNSLSLSLSLSIVSTFLWQC